MEDGCIVLNEQEETQRTVGRSSCLLVPCPFANAKRLQRIVLSPLWKSRAWNPGILMRLFLAPALCSASCLYKPSEIHTICRALQYIQALFLAWGQTLQAGCDRLVTQMAIELGQTKSLAAGAKPFCIIPLPAAKDWG